MDDHATRDPTRVTTSTGSVPDPYATTDPVPLDVVFNLLADDDRRIAIAYLLDVERRVPVSDLAAHVCEQKVGPAGDGNFDAAVERITRRLHHNHLPKLLGADLVEYDEDSGGISATARSEALRPFVELAKEYRERPEV